MDLTYADHDALVLDWQKNAARREKANFRFVRSLKMVDDPDQVDELARAQHARVFGKIDCTRCANCCKTMRANLNSQDIDRIAAHMNVTRQEFIDAFLIANPRERGEFLIKANPCPFLGADDRCTIYDIRPDNCRKFPHTDQEGFIWRTYLHAGNTLKCPGVYHIVEEMGKRIKGGAKK